MFSARGLLYTIGTLVVTGWTVYYAFEQHVHFFPTMVFLWSSKFCTLVLGNFALWALLMVAHAGKRVFLGDLRAQEMELLSDNIRPTIMSLLFFLTIFRTQFYSTFIAAIVLLVFTKAAHWVTEARVHYMEQSPSDSNWTYVRLGSLIVLLFLLDMTVVLWTASKTLITGPSLVLLFGFEYCILAVSCASMMVLFVLNLISIRREQTWHAKGSYVLYLEFCGSALQSLIYLAFFFIIFRHYGIPLHIIRSMYLTFASFYKSLSKLITYRRAISQMDQRYPDATVEELENADSVCIVCRDEMQVGKKLPCGHILHLECLRSWLQQDPTCPLCRKSVIIEDLYESDKITYAAEYQRFRLAQTRVPRGGAGARTQEHHQHQHQHQQQTQQQQSQQQQVQQQQQQQQQTHQQNVSSLDVEELKKQMEGLRSQLDFIQSLIIAQMEQQQQEQQQKQQQQEQQEEKLDEEEIRRRRLKAFK